MTAPTPPSDLDLSRLAEVPQHVKDEYIRTRFDENATAEESMRAVAALEAALTPPPLRTRAEVDREIAAEVRCWRDNVKTGAAYHSSPSPSSIEKFERLCAEPVRGDDPPQPERMTEAERALCELADTSVPWDESDVRRLPRTLIAHLNAVRDERRQRTKTKGATEPDARLPGSVRTPGTVETSVAPKEPCAYNCDSWEGGECTCGMFQFPSASTKTKGAAEAAAMRSEEHRAPASAAAPAAPPTELERVTHDEARQILRRFNASHFSNRGDMGERARYSIPANPKRDDDLRLAAYIDQSRAESSELERLRTALGEVREACDELPTYLGPEHAALLYSGCRRALRKAGF